MAMMGCGRQEKPMFEQCCDFPDRARHLAFDGPGGPGRGCGMMRLIQDEHRARPERRQNIAQPSYIGLVGKNAVRKDETRADTPGIRGKAAGAPRFEEVLPINDREVQAEFPFACATRIRTRNSISMGCSGGRMASSRWWRRTCR
jgi:hypothetical protein